jgi:hypothetical protein
MMTTVPLKVLEELRDLIRIADAALARYENACQGLGRLMSEGHDYHNTQSEREAINQYDHEFQDALHTIGVCVMANRDIISINCIEIGRNNDRNR